MELQSIDKSVEVFISYQYHTPVRQLQ